MRISAGSAGALATDADVLCFLCVILWAHHSAAARSFVHARVQCLMPLLNQRLHKFRTERIHRMVANGWATLSYQSLSFFLQLLVPQKLHSSLSRHIIIIIIITTLFQYFRFKNHKRLSSSFVFQIINNKFRI